MSYKDEVIRQLTNISSQNDSKSVADDITRMVENIYTKALLESKKTGQSVESITYEILEGLEEGLNTIHKTEIEKVLQNASHIITDVIHKCAQENILQKHQNLKRASEILDETIEAEKAHLLESMEAFKAYAHDHTHTLFADNLYHLQDKLNELIHTVADKIKESKK